MAGMTYVPAADRYDADALPPLRPQRPQAARRSRSGSGRTSATTGRSSTQRAIVRRAFDLGITHFDLANNYGPPYGSAERELRPDHGATTCGRTATSWSSRRRPATTCGPARTATGARASTCSRASTRASRRMGLDYVDIFYSHRFDPDTPLEETMGALDTAVRQGKALYVGISSYSAQRTAEAARILRDLGTPLLIHQPSYSLLNRWIEEDLLDVLGDEGVGCIVFSPLAQGMLTDQVPRRHPRGLARGGRDGSLSPDLLTERDARARPGAERDRAGARPDAGADGARLDAARPARHVDADRREQRRASSRRTSARSRRLDVHRRRARRRSTATPSRPGSTSGRRRARTDGPSAHRGGPSSSAPDRNLMPR